MYIYTLKIIYKQDTTVKILKILSLKDINYQL
jgi:hypothetical protein